MYLIGFLVRETMVKLTGDNCNFTNIKIETSRLSTTSTVSIKRKIFAILSKQGIFRTCFSLLELNFPFKEKDMRV